mmetsp:Transcript_24888/g.60352  ORF Transcript_24888/g.60352 Transcript_24888/m.60352 type:complete len:261 (+) Transcript_24888:335-1117(+)
MLLCVSCPIESSAKSLFRPLHEQTTNHQLCFFVLDVRRQHNFVPEDGSENLVLIVASTTERQITAYKLIQAHSERPVVHISCVALSHVDLGPDLLWRHELWSSHQGVGTPVHDLLSKTEIDQLDVTTHVQQNVLWLQVAVDNSTFVEKLQSHQHGSCIELRLRFAQDANLVQSVQQLTSTNELRQEIHARLVLEGSHKAHDEGVVHAGEDITLVAEGELVLLRQHMAALHTLQGVLRSSHTVLHHGHHTEATFPDDTHWL